MTKFLTLNGLAPKKCQGCTANIVDAFNDIKMRSGPWGFFCDTCVPKYSIARASFYGPGLGQRWIKQLDGRWIKQQG